MSAKPKRELAPITGVVVGELTEVDALARFILPYLRRPALRLVVDGDQQPSPSDPALSGKSKGSFEP